MSADESDRLLAEIEAKRGYVLEFHRILARADPTFLRASGQEVLELLELCLPPCGVPKFMRAFEVWREAFGDESGEA